MEKEYQTIKIDTAFHAEYVDKLHTALQDGWKIENKTVVGERYIMYLLVRDVEK